MWLEAGVSDLTNSKLLMISLLGRDDRRVGSQREVDSRVGYQVSLELGQIYVEGTIKAERSRDG